MTMIFESKNIEADKERILKILTSKGIKAAENDVTRQLNDENMNRGINGLPQNAQSTNPKYNAMYEVIENYKEALKDKNDKDELFKQFVLNHKEFKKWLEQNNK